jgi:hypothetical protein
MTEILKTTEDGRYRVRLERDDDAMQPEHDGGTPILRYEYGGWHREGYTVEQVENIGPTVPDGIVAALTRWGARDDLFERYLRMFHGTRSVVWEAPHRSGPDYVTFDTAAIREGFGLTGEYVAAHPEHFGEHGEKLANMDEYVAWLTGDAYGYVVEERVAWGRLDSDGDLKRHESDDDRMETWEVVDSCWGFYGDTEYLRETALEALAAASES